jgi:hypothetical protein
VPFFWVIVVGEKACLTVVAALNDVRRQVGDLKALAPWRVCGSDPGA